MPRRAVSLVGCPRWDEIPALHGRARRRLKIRRQTEIAISVQSRRAVGFRVPYVEETSSGGKISDCFSKQPSHAADKADRAAVSVRSRRGRTANWRASGMPAPSNSARRPEPQTGPPRFAPRLISSSTGSLHPTILLAQSLVIIRLSPPVKILLKEGNCR